MRAILKRARVWAVTSAIGGSVLALEGCDPLVRDTVLGGVGEAASGLATTFVEAFFESLRGQDDPNTPTTVQAAPLVEPAIFT